MAYLLDGLVILILAFCIWRGVKRGLVRTAVLLVGFVLAALVAANLSTPLATAIYDKGISPRLEQTLAEKAAETDAPKLEVRLSSVLGKGVSDYLVKYGVQESFSLDLTGSEEQVQAGIREALQNVVRPVVIKFTAVLCTVVLFLILLVVVVLLAGLLDKIFKLPLLRQANRVGGFLLGVLQGVFWAAVFATLADFLAGVGVLPEWLTPDAVAHTALVSRISVLNWLM